MESKDLLKKQELAEELGMKFDEASVLFSEETLETMRMMNVVGGSDEVHSNCQGAYCGNCVTGCEGAKNEGCSPKKPDCEVKIICHTNVAKCETTSETTTPETTTPSIPETTTPDPEEPTIPIGPGENLPDPT